MAKRPEWQRTDVTWEVKLKVWERMALGSNDSQIEVWLDREEHLDRKTIGQVRLELQALPEEYVSDLSEKVQNFRKDLRKDLVSPAPTTQEAGSAISRTSVRTESVLRHEELVRIIAVGILEALVKLQPVPSALFRYDQTGDFVPGRDQDAVNEITSSAADFAALKQHLSATGYPSEITEFLEALTRYREAGGSAVKHIQELLEVVLAADVIPRAAVALFFQALDLTCTASQRFQGTWAEAQNRFVHSTMMVSQAVHHGGSKLFFYDGHVQTTGPNLPREEWDEQPINVEIGPYSIGRVESYEEAVKALRGLSELGKSLPEEQPILALAETYFDLEVQRNRVLEHLAPISVEKWLVDGRCELCPSHGQF